MSVLVKKMKFPKSCWECDFCINCDGCEGHENYCAAAQERDSEGFIISGLGYDPDSNVVKGTPRTPTNKRMEWCPLVEIDSKIFDKEETALDAFDEQFDRAAQSAALGARYEEENE